MKKVAILFCCLFLLCSCGKKSETQKEMSEYDHVTCSEKDDLVKSGAVLIDVRSKEEYDENHLDDAINIPYNEIFDKIEGQVSKKDTKIIVYCQSGRRSELAAKTLLNMGYTSVHDLGGIGNCD